MLNRCKVFANIRFFGEKYLYSMWANGQIELIMQDSNKIFLRCVNFSTANNDFSKIQISLSLTNEIG